MAFEKFPRPPDDSGIGYHFGTDRQDWATEPLGYWLDELSALGASWLVLPGSFESPVPTPFVRDLVEHKIEPILRLDVWPIRPVDQSALAALCHAYADAGAHYLHLYREPNLATQWQIADWIAPGLVTRFGSLLLPSLETIRSNGLIPLLSPLAPGGHYWDLTFLRQLLGFLTHEAASDLLDDLGVCIHNYPTNRPLSWGEGGAARWPTARPYAPAEAGEDHRGFRLFEWYDEVIRSHLGRSLPMFCGETGLVLGTRDQLVFPRVDDTVHRERTLAIAELAWRRALPSYLFNVAFWTLNAGDDDPVDTHAWYRRDGSHIPTVDALKEWVGQRQPRSEEIASSGQMPTLIPEPKIPVSATAEATDQADVGDADGLDACDPNHPIKHYILLELGMVEPRDLSGYLGVLLPYAARSRATFGFRREEAGLAERVTVVGSDAVGLIRLQRELQLHGCEVALLHAMSPDDLRTALTSVA